MATLRGSWADVERLMGDKTADKDAGRQAAYDWFSRAQLDRIDRLVETRTPDEFERVISDVRTELLTDPSFFQFIRGILAGWGGRKNDPR